MNRSTLDALAKHYQLSEAGVEAAMAAARARPDETEQRRAVRLTAALAGALSVGSGVIFFIAANWHAVKVLGRFALVEVLLLLAVLLALYRPPPSLIGRLAVGVAILMTGGLLALFGQTYQTGADLFELFFLWAALSLPFAIAARWSTTWALWVLVLNLGLGLFCGWVPGRHVLWLVFDRWGFSHALLIALAMQINLLLWGLAEWRGQVETDPHTSAAPRWLRRALLVIALIYGTAAMLYILFDHRSEDRQALAVLAYFVGCGILLFRTLQQRTDVLPLAALAGSAIVVFNSWLGQLMHADLSAFFALTVSLIGCSAVSGFVLMNVHRSWHTKESEE